MKLKKTYLIIGMLLSILTAIYSCNNQGKIDNVQILLNQESNVGNKTKLDSNTTIIYQDKKDNFWFASEEKGVYKYNGENLILFNSNDGLESYRIISVQEDNVGNLYFDTPEGVYKYNGEKFTALSVVDSKEPENEWKSEPEDLWFRIGWDKRGPYRFDGQNLYHLKFPKNKMEDEFNKKYPNSSVNPYSIYSVYKDSKGNIWFGTAYLGVYLFDGKEISWMYESQLTETLGGGDFGVRSMIEDEDGNYWICNANYKYTLFPNDSVSDGLKLINYKRQVGIENIVKKDLYFYSMETDNNGDLLMFAKEYGFWLNNGKELTQFFIKDGEQNISPTSMYKDNQGTFWFSTDKYGIYKYNGGTFKKLELK
jgi:ligand-binding sensor domain-containing protein